MFGTLYIVATPIGNLQDVTLRAIEVLRTVDLVLCEDTRVGGKLLHHLGLKKSLKSYHEHSSVRDEQFILSELENGKNIALITDAGTPGISDPGNRLLQFLANSPQPIVVAPIPGPSAVVAALSVSGFPTDKFLFLGFPPHKNKRQKFFNEVAESEYTVCFYESCHRIKKCLGELAKVLDPKREILVARELTKLHESLYRGTITQILSQPIPEKGEFVVVVRGV